MPREEHIFSDAVLASVRLFAGMLRRNGKDFSSEDEIYQIITDPNDFSSVREKLEESGLEFLEADVQMVPTTTVSLDEKGQEKMERLLEKLDELDDVSNVYHNWAE